MQSPNLRKCATNVAVVTSALAMALGAGAAALAQPAPSCDYPSLPREGRSLSDFTPAGWPLEAKATGLLVEGGLPSVALVFKSNAPAGSPCADQRVLAVLTERSGGFELVTSNHTLFPTNADKAQGFGPSWALAALGRTRPLEIKRGSLVVRLQFVWDSGPNAEEDDAFTFRIRDGRLILVGYDEFDAGYTSGTAETSYDFLTGKARLTLGSSCAGRLDVVAHRREKSVRKPITSSKGPIPIEDVGDALAFSPHPDIADLVDTAPSSPSGSP
jgi:hypothetical protein